MAIGNITSANSVFTIASADLAIVATKLEGYSTDSSFTMDQVETAVAQLGVDGRVSVGWVPQLVQITLSFSADSPSVALMNDIVTAMNVARNPVFITGTLEIPSIGKSYNFGRGTITSATIMPSGGRVLNPHSYVLTFEQCKPSAI